ncbi:MAG: hypothetical protein AAF432_11570 [Planctomycetota bacterium]
MLLRRLVGRVTHHLLGELRRDALPGHRGAKRRAERMQIDFPAILVRRDHAELWLRPRAGSNHDDVPGVITDDFLTRQTSAKKVALTRPVRDSFREHPRRPDRRMFRQSLMERIRELWMHRNLVDPFRLPIGNRDGVGVKVHIGPLQSNQITTP